MTPIEAMTRAMAPHIAGPSFDDLAPDRVLQKVWHREGKVLDINQPTKADLLEAAKAALEAYEAARWRPIEEAPKDGTDVFLYVPGDSLYPTAGHFLSSQTCEEEYGDPDYMEEGWYWAYGYPSDFHECPLTPTHWMPIPKAPEVVE